MEWHVIVGVFFIVIMIILLSYSINKKRNKAFDEDKHIGVGIVVGHDRKQQISANDFTCDLKIKIPEINEKNVFLCLTSGVNPSDYPVGTIVNIYYAQSSGKIPVVRARLIENGDSEI